VLLPERGTFFLLFDEFSLVLGQSKEEFKFGPKGAVVVLALREFP